MPVIREQDAVRHHLHGSVFHSFAAPASGSRELCAWRLEVAPHTAGAAHRVSKEEVFLLLTGSLDVTLDGTTSTIGPGEAALVPAGAEVRVDNVGADPATMWVTTSAGLLATLPDGSTLAPPWTR
jgi:mannose-6-phosphate isomerase-like protein (cupin superfamily)